MIEPVFMRATRQGANFTLVVCGVVALVLRRYGLDEEYGDVRLELDRRGKRE